MTTHFQAPLSVPELAERATNMMDEACALARLASDLGEFERTTGRKLLVSEAEERTTGPDLVFEGRNPEAADWLQDLSGIAFENAAQADGDKLGEAELIDTGSAETVTDPQPAPVVSHETLVHVTQTGLSDTGEPQQPAADAPAAAAKPSPKPAAPGTGRASYATGKPKVALNAKGDNRAWGKLTLPEREIVKHLERLPKSFTPQDDLRLAELLTNGNKIDAAAAFLEVEADAALTRWKSLLCEDVIGANGKPTIDGQKQLLNALRYRVETCQ